jgi:hypothetical protein
MYEGGDWQTLDNYWQTFDKMPPLESHESAFVWCTDFMNVWIANYYTMSTLSPMRLDSMRWALIEYPLVPDRDDL